MKGNSFLLAAIFLLAFVSLLLLSAPHPVQAAALQDPIQPDEGQPAGFSIRQLFSGWGGFFVALALLWLVASVIMAVRDVIVTKNTHGPGVGHW